MNRRSFLQSILVAIGALFIPISLLPKEEVKVLKEFKGTRKLKTVWTPETVQDLEYIISIDAEKELTKLLNEQIRKDVDNLVMKDIWLS